MLENIEGKHRWKDSTFCCKLSD